MREPSENTDFPLMCEIEDEEARHEHMRALIHRSLEHLCHDSKKETCTLTQLASRLNISVEELRDDARLWKDTDIRMRRIITRLKSRLHDRVLKWEDNAARAKAALYILELEMKEGQLSSSNRIMAEHGTGLMVKILNYGEFEDGKPIEGGDKYSCQDKRQGAAEREAKKDPDAESG